MLSFRRFATGCLLVLAASALRAQQLPTPDQAKRLLETRPDLVAMLVQQIAASGLTPDQIRARLRAAGYPEDLLDAYIGGSGSSGTRRTGRDSLSVAFPSDDVLDAVGALGIADSVDTSELRAMLRRRRAAGLGRDTLRLSSDSAFISDSLSMLDSLGLVDSVDMRAVVDSLGRVTFVPRRLLVRGTRRPVVKLDTGATLFGLKIFRGETTQFDANLAGPVDASYRLGPGDRLVLILTGDVERAYTLDVTREGFIVIPEVGQVPVANLTLGQLDELLYQRLGRKYSGLKRGPGASTQFSLNVAKLHSNQIFVYGDVDQPGSYKVSSAGTALTALYAAGGPTPNGSFRRVEVRRGGRLMDTLDLYDYLLRADGSHDPRLQSGDVVFVPVHGPRVRVYGEVVRPGTYEVRRGETLADMLQAAGGFTAEAARRRVQVSRVLPPSERDTTDRARVVIDIASAQFASGSGPAFPLEPGDVVHVFPVSERVSRRITVRGDVYTPGTIGLTPGMRLSDAIRTSGGLKPDAFLGQVLVSRLRAADSTRMQLRSAFQDSTGRPTDDLLLREDDEIRVFSVTEFRAPEYVAITGAVRKGGRFAYHEGMTLRDAVLLAGGLDDRAYLKEAEVARLPDSRDGGRMAVTQRVPLDSSYLVGREGIGGARGPVGREVILSRYDNILILAQPDWERPRRVVVAGEVQFPGTYTLTSKGDRLSDLFKRAGGVTTMAYPDGVVFYRRQGRVGRVGVDLPSVLRDPGYRDNLILVDGDSIYVPQFNAIVQVQGSVSAPRGVAYVPGADLKYYVRAAGGPDRTAEMERAYVTQPDGNVESVVVRLLRPDVTPVPRPGSTVFVPQKDMTDRSDSFARLGVIAQIIGSLVAIVAITRHP